MIRRARYLIAGALGPVGLALLHAADRLIELPPGVEVRHYLGADILTPPWTDGT